MTDELAIAKLEVIRSMTDLESVRQVIDVLIPLITAKDFKGMGNNVIGFSAGDTVVVGVEDD